MSPNFSGGETNGGRNYGTLSVETSQPVHDTLPQATGTAGRLFEGYAIPAEPVGEKATILGPSDLID